MPDAGPGIFSFDTINGPAATVRTAGSLLIAGWAFADVQQPVPPHIHLELRSEKTGEVLRIPAERLSRPDVGIHFGNPALEMAGWHALIPLHHTMNGPHFLSLVQVDGDRVYRAVDPVRLDPEVQAYELSARDGLAAKYLFGEGIEIGALQRRLNLPASCKVRYVDRFPYEQLLEHYPELRGIPVQRPDIIDDGETLSTIADLSQDFVAANHFLEHCANPVGAIRNLLRVIRPGGFLYMAVPERFHTFDILRPPTPYETLREAYQTGIRSGRSNLFTEWARFVMRVANPDVAATAAALERDNYSIHYNVWALPELLDFFLRIRSDFSLPFELAAVVSCENEVIVVLNRTSGGLG